MSDKTALGDRMKGYEHITRFRLPLRTPMIIWTRRHERRKTARSP